MSDARWDAKQIGEYRQVDNEDFSVSIWLAGWRWEDDTGQSMECYPDDMPTLHLSQEQITEAGGLEKVRIGGCGWTLGEIEAAAG